MSTVPVQYPCMAVPRDHLEVQTHLNGNTSIHTVVDGIGAAIDLSSADADAVAKQLIWRRNSGIPIPTEPAPLTQEAKVLAKAQELLWQSIMTQNYWLDKARAMLNPIPTTVEEIDTYVDAVGRCAGLSWDTGRAEIAQQFHEWLKAARREGPL